MLKFEEICDLVRLVGSTGVARVEIEHGGGRVAIDGRPPVQMVTAAEVGSLAHQGAASSGAPHDGQGPEAALTSGEATEDGLTIIPSPIVGTFYRAPNPDAEPYVKVGDDVNSGQVLCIVEAMKLMNEIECDMEGKIVKIFPDNAEPVEYGQPLFAIRPA